MYIMIKKLKDYTFDELVDLQLSEMIRELAKGTPWRSILWSAMEFALRWAEVRKDK
jgi:hypothetical protein